MIVKVLVNQSGHIRAYNTPFCTIDFDTEVQTGDQSKWIYINGVWSIDPNYIPTDSPTPCITWNGTEWIETSYIFKYGKERPIIIIMPTMLTIADAPFAKLSNNILTFKSPYELSEDETYNTVWLKKFFTSTDEENLMNAYPYGVRIYKLV